MGWPSSEEEGIRWRSAATKWRADRRGVEAAWRAACHPRRQPGHTREHHRRAAHGGHRGEASVERRCGRRSQGDQKGTEAGGRHGAWRSSWRDPGEGLLWWEEECVDPTLRLREARHQQPGRSVSRIVNYKTGEWKNSHDPPTRPNRRPTPKIRGAPPTAGQLWRSRRRSSWWRATLRSSGLTSETS